LKKYTEALGAAHLEVAPAHEERVQARPRRRLVRRPIAAGQETRPPLLACFVTAAASAAATATATAFALVAPLVGDDRSRRNLVGWPTLRRKACRPGPIIGRLPLLLMVVVLLFLLLLR
jgi:hypothetical protein